jgi:TATA-box binding protein (TBP) (component of TFIID and TFIIIB)
MKNENLEIQNVVGSGQLPQKIKLDVLSEDIESFTWSDKDNEQPGLYWELEKENGRLKPAKQKDSDGPQITLHQSGKYIARASSKELLERTNNYLKECLSELGILSGESYNADFEIVNVVGLSNLDTRLMLRILVDDLNDESTDNPFPEYTPEQFPAVKYTKPSYNCKFLIYNTGKIISIGGDSVEGSKQDMDDFMQELNENHFVGL